MENGVGIWEGAAAARAPRASPARPAAHAGLRAALGGGAAAAAARADSRRGGRRRAVGRRREDVQRVLRADRHHVALRVVRVVQHLTRGEGRMRSRWRREGGRSRVRTFLLKLTERLSLRAAPPHPLNAERRGDAVVASSVMGSGVPASTPSGPDTSQMCSFESYEPEHTDRPCGEGGGEGW